VIRVAHDSTLSFFPSSVQGCHFDQAIILLCVRWYFTYKLSYRDLRAILAERGIDLAHTTITVGAAVRSRVYKALAAVRAPQRTFMAYRRNVYQDERALGFSVSRG